jgi:hypothetical protein
LLGRSTRNRSCWTSWTYATKRWGRMGSRCRLLREPQGPPAHGLSLLCSRACAAETWPAHPRILLQDRRAWSHLLRAILVLLSHHWPSTCSRVACCPECALACGIELSQPSALRRASDPHRAAPASSAAFSSTASDVLHAQLHCSLGGSAPSRRATTPRASRSAPAPPALRTPEPRVTLARAAPCLHRPRQTVPRGARWATTRSPTRGALLSPC